MESNRKCPGKTRMEHNIIPITLIGSYDFKASHFSRGMCSYSRKQKQYRFQMGDPKNVGMKNVL